ncbi:MAG: hypothetical protein QNJ46_07740 [Leptolyngbyaceae cyanobacterium MO_188.B28]|nr:hypothetical protein [Leptolyngbyaceae cyanobacterium MO_188.B28]
MTKPLHLSALLSMAVALGLAADLNSPVWGQPEGVCFVVDEFGSVWDLDSLCRPPEDKSVLGTGDVQVTLRWSSEDDLDLEVTDPNGETATFLNPYLSSGGELDADANAVCEDTTNEPVENIYWPFGGGIPGDYVVTVNLFSFCTANSQVEFSLTILVQGETQELSGAVDETNPIANFSFSFPPDGKSDANRT